MKAFLSIVVILSCLNSVFACSPWGYPNPPLECIAAKTGRIFIGTVVSKSAVVLKHDFYKFRLHRVTFRVEKALKGGDGEFQTINFKESISGRTSCYRKPREFKKGSQWMIYDKYQNADAERIIIGFNYGYYSEYSQKNDGENFEYLENVIKNPTTGIYGEVHTVRSSSYLSDAEVVAESNAERLTTRTNQYGEYSFKGIPAGIYKVRIYLPYRTLDLFNDRKPIFDEQKQTFYLEYVVTVNPSDSEYEFTVVNGKN